jgi:hypothetical protein
MHNDLDGRGTPVTMRGGSVNIISIPSLRDPLFIYSRKISFLKVSVISYLLSTLQTMLIWRNTDPLLFLVGVLSLLYH